MTTQSLLKSTMAAAALVLPFGLVASENDGPKELEEVDVVPSGTYDVTAHVVDPEEKEIYVKMADDKILELYFKESTKLTNSGETVPFSALEKGQKLEVEVEKSGDHMNPVTVSILPCEDGEE